MAFVEISGFSGRRVGREGAYRKRWELIPKLGSSISINPEPHGKWFGKGPSTVGVAPRLMWSSWRGGKAVNWLPAVYLTVCLSLRTGFLYSN